MSPLAEEIIALIDRNPDVVEQVRANASTAWDTDQARIWIATRIVESKIERMEVPARDAFLALGQILLGWMARASIQASIAAAIASHLVTQPADTATPKDGAP